MKFLSTVAAVIVNNIGARELTLAAGLGGVWYGISLVNLPAAFIVSGGILVYVAIAGVR